MNQVIITITETDDGGVLLKAQTKGKAGSKAVKVAAQLLSPLPWQASQPVNPPPERLQ